MLEGKCLRCGTRQIGWALLSPRYQTCPKCGAGLEIRNGDIIISKGYSPFTADRYLLRPLREVFQPEPKDKDRDAKDR